MRRGDNYDEELSAKLQSKRFAQNYIEALMEGEDGLSVEQALKHTIERMGVKEFCDISGVVSSNVHEFLNGSRKLKPETLDVYLKPFGLRTRIVLEKAS